MCLTDVEVIVYHFLLVLLDFRTVWNGIPFSPIAMAVLPFWQIDLRYKLNLRLFPKKCVLIFALLACSKHSEVSN